MATLRDGTLSYVGYVDAEDGKRRGFPWPVDGMTGTVRLNGPLLEIAASARHGDASVQVTGTLNEDGTTVQVTSIEQVKEKA